MNFSENTQLLHIVASAADETSRGQGTGQRGGAKAGRAQGCPGAGGEGPRVEGPRASLAVTGAWRRLVAHGEVVGHTDLGALVQQGTCLGSWVLSEGGTWGPACLPLTQQEVAMTRDEEESALPGTAQHHTPCVSPVILGVGVSRDCRWGRLRLRAVGTVVTKC